MSDSSIVPSRRVHYGWIVVVVTFLVLLVASGVRGAPGVLIVPMEQEFGWTRAGISLPISISLLVYGIVGPFSAAFIDRFGMRVVVLVAMVMLLIGFGPTVVSAQTWQLIPLWGVFAGLGTGILAMILAAMVSNRWFVKRRGLVMGLLTGSAAAGSLVFLPTLASVAVNVGWRWAVAIPCVAVVVVIPLVVLFLRDKPSDVGLKPYRRPRGFRRARRLRAPIPSPLRSRRWATACAAAISGCSAAASSSAA